MLQCYVDSPEAADLSDSPKVLRCEQQNLGIICFASYKPLGLQMGLIIFPLLPPPVTFSSCFPVLPSLLSIQVCLHVLLGCVDHPMGAASATACSSPKVAGAKWGHLPQHWSQMDPAGPLAIPTRVQVPMPSPWPMLCSSHRAQRVFGRCLQLHVPLALTLCCRCCVSQLHLCHRSLGVCP